MTHLWWYVARSSGIVTWALSAASVIWGLALSTTKVRATTRPAWVLDLHRFLGGLATIFCVVHVVALMFDSYVSFSLVDALVPFATSWHPVAVAWGIVAFYLLIAVEISSLLRKKLSKNVWRAIHFTSFPLFVFASIHTIYSGTDAANPIFRTLVILVTGLVTAMTAMRAIQPARHRKSTHPITR
jgi:predicted ferric reductase